MTISLPIPRRSRLALSLSLVLGGCGDGAASADADPATGAPKLVALSEVDVTAARLSGELACSFATKAGAPLLHATGDVGTSKPAMALVKEGNTTELLHAPGGFNGIVNGATFSGKGSEVRIENIAEPRGGGESPPRAATLTYTRLGGDRYVATGSWTCGP